MITIVIIFIVVIGLPENTKIDLIHKHFSPDPWKVERTFYGYFIMETQEVARLDSPLVFIAKI